MALKKRDNKTINSILSTEPASSSVATPEPKAVAPSKKSWGVNVTKDYLGGGMIITGYPGPFQGKKPIIKRPKIK